MTNWDVTQVAASRANGDRQHGQTGLMKGPPNEFAWLVMPKTLCQRERLAACPSMPRLLTATAPNTEGDRPPMMDLLSRCLSSGVKHQKTVQAPCENFVPRAAMKPPHGHRTRSAFPNAGAVRGRLFTVLRAGSSSSAAGSSCTRPQVPAHHCAGRSPQLCGRPASPGCRDDCCSTPP